MFIRVPRFEIHAYSSGAESESCEDVTTDLFGKSSNAFAPWTREFSKRTYRNISPTFTSSTAQGGGGSFKKRKTIGEIGCCESRMSEQNTDQLTN